MSDRFYQQQLDATGRCPGAPLSARRKRVAWTEEQRKEAVEKYLEAEPTPETSTEIVKQIAEEMEQSPNGVRMILVKEGVYVKQTPPEAGAKSSKSSSSTGGSRVGKAAAQEALSKALVDAGVDVDDDIVSKLTGKAAVYFTDVITKLAQ